MKSNEQLIRGRKGRTRRCHLGRTLDSEASPFPFKFQLSPSFTVLISPPLFPFRIASQAKNTKCSATLHFKIFPSSFPLLSFHFNICFSSEEYEMHIKRCLHQPTQNIERTITCATFIPRIIKKNPT